MERFDLGHSLWGIKRSLSLSDSEAVVTHQEQVSPIFDQNQRQRNEGAGRVKSSHHVARLPMTTYYAWRNEWKANFADTWEWKTFLAMRLRDRDYSKLRTSDMKA